MQGTGIEEADGQDSRVHEMEERVGVWEILQWGDEEKLGPEE